MDSLTKYDQWLSSAYIDQETKYELIKIRDNPDEIKDRFYRDLEFGTGGLRGVIGAGTNRINIYTIRKATQGLANFIIAAHSGAGQNAVAIAYDSRHFSDLFAKETALVLAGNGIKAYLFESLRSTPELSFAVRHLKCAGGVVVTASHNPPAYNGYKAYGPDGGQMTLDDANCVIDCIGKIAGWEGIKRLDENEAKVRGLLEIIGETIDAAYLKRIKELSLRPELAKQSADFHVVYTSLHGSGFMPVTRCLRELGYANIHPVPEQTTPDGDFPTVKSPNPEDPAAFHLAIKLAQKISADLIFGTDPDCDRVGVVVRDRWGEYQPLTGNQVGALLVNYLLSSQAKVSSEDAIIKTIVTSELGAEIAKSYGATVFNTLTGFKFIGEKIQEFIDDQSYHFVLGYEESYGYLAGDFVRDKDAVIASMLIVEMAAYYYSRGQTLFDVLEEIYQQFGYYADGLSSFSFPGAEGQEKIRLFMDGVRNYPRLAAALPGIDFIEDYQRRERKWLAAETVEPLTLPQSDVVKVVFDDASWLAIRPSGTEPKLKIYYSGRGWTEKEAGERLADMQLAMKKLM